MFLFFHFLLALVSARRWISTVEKEHDYQEVDLMDELLVKAASTSLSYLEFQARKGIDLMLENIASAKKKVSKDGESRYIIVARVRVQDTHRFLLSDTMMCRFDVTLKRSGSTTTIVCEKSHLYE